jgi:hypothetical protein
MLKSICNIQFAMGKLSSLIALRRLADWGVKEKRAVETALYH